MIVIYYIKNGQACIVCSIIEMACRKALQLLEERKYAKRLNRHRIKKIVKYGMVFCEKECMVVMA